MRTAFAGLMAGVLVALAPAAPALADDRHSFDLGAISNPDWMAGISDDTSLAALSIPGTHDTMARDVTALAETQESPLPEQLDAGVRALDIRTRHFQDAFTIHHGSVYLNANFTDVLRQTTDFLRAHPTETVLMRIKPEHTAEQNTRTYEETLDWYLTENPDTAGLARDHIWTPPSGEYATRIPDLGEVRGRIVILQNFDGAGTVYGPTWAGEGMAIQDDYEVPTLFDIEGKWEKARDHFDATQDGPADVLHVNHFSGTGLGAFPRDVAAGALGFRGVNDYGLSHLRDTDLERTGVVMADYPGPGLVEEILAENP
ncbi:phosphatidylinositol-specific phospholipase C [Nocardiopsis sediminis]|uniref:1-phosphatidylinositol phosphodiesterase n=1 Tax=Nocardiopsis sediminis TaxID=1778267 RepID=A0ABV8FL49_9ACTN